MATALGALLLRALCPHSPQSRLWGGREDPHPPGRELLGLRTSQNYWSWGGLWHTGLHVGVPGRTQSTPGPHTKGLAGMLGSPQECWNHWTGPCEDLEF